MIADAVVLLGGFVLGTLAALDLPSIHGLNADQRRDLYGARDALEIELRDIQRKKRFSP